MLVCHLRGIANGSFYIYCIIWAVVSYAHGIASAITYATNDSSETSTCVLDVTRFIYFSLYGPLVYVVFLRGFFRYSNNLLVEYCAHN